MIILGSTWTSGSIDLQLLTDDADVNLTGRTYQAAFYEKIGVGYDTDDYGWDGTADLTALITVDSSDGGVVYDDAVAGIFHLYLTAAQTRTLRQNLSGDGFSGRMLTVQIKRIDGAFEDHVLFITERTSPGG